MSAYLHFFGGNIHGILYTIFDQELLHKSKGCISTEICTTTRAEFRLKSHRNGACRWNYGRDLSVIVRTWGILRSDSSILTRSQKRIQKGTKTHQKDTKMAPKMNQELSKRSPGTHQNHGETHHWLQNGAPRRKYRFWTDFRTIRGSISAPLWLRNSRKCPKKPYAKSM